MLLYKKLLLVTFGTTLVSNEMKRFYISFIKKVKVKVTLVQALRFCTSCTAHRGSRGIALPFLDHGTRRG